MIDNYEYDSPIKFLMGELNNSIEENALTTVQSYGFDVNLQELKKALAYDRNQYEKGFKAGQSSFSNNLTKIANTVASSSDCRHCAIKDFCQTVSDSSLCEYVWSEWISKQLEN